MAKTAPAARPAAPAPEKKAHTASAGIRVRALELGYYDDQRRRIGDVFTLHDREGTFTEIARDKNGDPKLDKQGYPVTKEVKKVLTAESQFSEKWMERVDPTTPEKVTTPSEALKQKHDEQMAARHSGGGTPTGASSPLGDD